MSHDRGCWKCGREQWEYKHCSERDCAKADLVQSRRDRERTAADNIYHKETSAMTKRSFQSTKTYTHASGFSCCFRQWRAESHCKYLHGYALQIKLVFEGELDHRNWIVDFGGLKNLKGWLEDWFDHKTLVAEDDPLINTFKALSDQKLIQLRIVPHTGCERFAEMIYEYTEQWLKDAGFSNARLVSVEVKEHEGNSAICVG